MLRRELALEARVLTDLRKVQRAHASLVSRVAGRSCSCVGASPDKARSPAASSAKIARRALASRQGKTIIWLSPAAKSTFRVSSHSSHQRKAEPLGSGRLRKRV